MPILLLIIGLLLFVGLVVVHELGHYLVARRNGIDVEEFGIGFPPRAKLLTTKKGTEYSLNWLPLGGFVKLKGEHDSDTQKGSFGAASLWAKTKVMLAGVGMNLLAAFVIFTFIALVGMPQILDNQFRVSSDSRVVRQEVLVGYLEADSPAAQAGLRQRDRIVAIGPAEAANPSHVSNPVAGLTPVSSQDQLPHLTSALAGKEATIIYEHNGQRKEATVQLRSQKDVSDSLKTNNPKGYLGVSPTQYSLQRSTWSAPVVALGVMKQITVATFQGLGHAISSLFHGQGSEASSQVAGPVGIFVLLKDGSTLGYQFMLLIVAIISLTLAIMNVLPIPALDGGRLFVMLISRALRKPLSAKAEETISGVGFMLLMILFVVITIVDVRRNF